MSTLADDVRDAMMSTEEAPAAPEAVEAEAPPVESAPAAPEAVDAPKSAEGRDEKGRFTEKAKSAEVKGAPVKPTAKPATETPAPVVPEAPAEAPKPVIEKAPAGWKPAAREKWAALPPEVRAEVARREKESTTAMQESAEARKLAGAFQETVAPFLGMIQSEGGEPLKAVGNLLRTAHALRTAPPAHKAALVAELVHSFGVDLQQLDGAIAARLEGKAPAAGAAPAEYRDPRVDRLLGELSSSRQRTMETQRAQAESELATFAEKAEFFDDVRETMADLLDVAARRGQAMTLQEAYDTALALPAHKDIKAIVSQREAAKAAQEKAAAVAKAKAASSSLRGAPPTGIEAPPESASVADDVRAAFASSRQRA